MPVVLLFHTLGSVVLLSLALLPRVPALDSPVLVLAHASLAQVLALALLVPAVTVQATALLRVMVTAVAVGGTDAGHVMVPMRMTAIAIALPAATTPTGTAPGSKATGALGFAAKIESGWRC